MQLLSKQQWRSCFCNNWLGKNLCSSGIAFYKINWNINRIRLMGVWHDVIVWLCYSWLKWPIPMNELKRPVNDPRESQPLWAYFLFFFWGFRNWPSDSNQGTFKGSFLRRPESQSEHASIPSPTPPYLGWVCQGLSSQLLMNILRSRPAVKGF